MQIPILRIPFTDDDIGFVQEGIRQIMKSGYLVMGKYTQMFEEKFKEFVGCKYAIATNSCTSALEIILRALDVERSTVIVPTNTFVATAFSAIHAGAKVIFADSMKENFCLDPDDLKRKIKSHTKAVIVVHIGGIISPYIEEIKAICEEKGIYLIEDAAHAHGCSHKGIPASRWGIAGAFSFFPTKVLTSGEGGIITTDDEEIYKRSLILRNHGKNPEQKNSITHLGYNWRMSELNAVLAVQQMNKADWIISERRRVATFYDENLKNINGIRPLELNNDLYSTYYKYICYLDEGINRDKFKKTLKEKYGISLTGGVYDVPCHDEPYFKNEKECVLNPNDNFPGANYIKKHHICLPCYPGLRKEELEYTVKSIKKCLNKIT